MLLRPANGSDDAGGTKVVRGENSFGEHSGWPIKIVHHIMQGNDASRCEMRCEVVKITDSTFPSMVAINP